MARMATEYFPGSSRSRGKLYSPLAFVTTVRVIVEPTRCALTSTPSIVPSGAEVTFRARADGVCAMAGAQIRPAKNAVLRIDERVPRIWWVTVNPPLRHESPMSRAQDSLSGRASQNPAVPSRRSALLHAFGFQVPAIQRQTLGDAGLPAAVSVERHRRLEL